MLFINLNAQQTSYKSQDDSLIIINVGKHPDFSHVKTAKIIVTESYKYGIQLDLGLSYKKTMIELLQYAKIKEDSINYDLIIRIEVKGEPFICNYTGQIKGSHYSAVNLQVNVIFDNLAKVIFEYNLSKLISCPETIYRSYTEPKSAPFGEAYRSSMGTFMSSIYKPLGGIPLIEAMQDSNEFFSNAAANAISNCFRNANHYIHNTNDFKWAYTESAKNKVPELILLLKNKDNDKRNAAAILLGILNDSSAINHLFAALEDKSIYVCISAAESLNKIAPYWSSSEEAKKTVPKFITALMNKDDLNVRRKAATILGIIKDCDAVEPLISALKVSDNNLMVTEITNALGNINDSCAVIPLISALSYKNWEYSEPVRVSAANALGSIKDDRAVEPLITALDDQCSGVVRAAAFALGQINDSRSVEPLIAKLNTFDDMTKEAAARALGNTKDKRAIVALILMLEKGKYIYPSKKVAVEMLKKMTGQDFGYDQKKWMKWWENHKNTLNN